MVQPDNLIVCKEVGGNFISGAPLIIVEILSRSTEQKDKTAKFKLYEKEGIPFYLIVDPEASLVKVFDLFEGRYTKRLDATKEVISFVLGPCRYYSAHV